jgi:2-oxoisovalerate dehydrogenase E1 component
VHLRYQRSIFVVIGAGEAYCLSRVWTFCDLRVSGCVRERALVRIFRDMVVIREFETMLDRIKKEGVYQGIEYQHKGPAHLSIGQEASVVGQAWHLTPEDFIFGSHRSHGEILAKGLSRSTSSTTPRSSRSWKPTTTATRSKWSRPSTKTQRGVKGLALDYLLFGALAEIFGRYAGFNRGMGGSMHAFFPPFGVMPNNAIVGGSADIATGAALFKRVNRRPGIVIANIGDASMGCGPVWEAMMFAAMDQYRKLWPEEAGGAPPMMFNFFNNFYGMGGQPYGETMGFEVLARVGLGVNPEAMHASASTATTRWPWPKRSPARSRFCSKAAARCCSTPSPTASPATRPPTRRPIAPRKRSTSGASTTR